MSEASNYIKTCYHYNHEENFLEYTRNDPEPDVAEQVYCPHRTSSACIYLFNDHSMVWVDDIKAIDCEHLNLDRAISDKIKDALSEHYELKRERQEKQLDSWFQDWCHDSFKDN